MKAVTFRGRPGSGAGAALPKAGQRPGARAPLLRLRSPAPAGGRDRRWQPCPAWTWAGAGRPAIPAGSRRPDRAGPHARLAAAGRLLPVPRRAGRGRERHRACAQGLPGPVRRAWWARNIRRHAGRQDGRHAGTGPRHRAGRAAFGRRSKRRLVIKTVLAMKKHLYHLLVFSLLGIFAASCSDDDDAPNIQSEIVGEWRLTSWSESAPEGFEVYVEFTSASTFGLYQKVETSDYTRYTGRYSIDGTRLTGVYDDGESWGSRFSYRSSPRPPRTRSEACSSRSSRCAGVRMRPRNPPWPRP